MKRILLLLLAAVLMLGLAGCDTVSQFLAGVQGGDDVAVHESAVGQNISTLFFDFKVISAEAADEYAGHTPPAGQKLVLVRVETTNTGEEPIPMYDYDYQLQWGDRAATEDGYAVVLDALDEACAPLEIELASGDTMTWFYVYEAPKGVADFELCYQEEYTTEDSAEGEFELGDIYYVQLSA